MSSMVCPQCEEIERDFNYKFARKELRKYQKKGIAKVTRILISHLQSEGLKGLSLLDIGGGAGVIQLELLKNGMTSAFSVEASTGYLRAAKEEAERQGLSDRIDFYHGNFVDLASDVPEADVVTLDSVICCYPNMDLVESSISHARKLYGVTYPLDNWLLKGYAIVVNLLNWAKRKKFRFFIHPKARIHAITKAHGFKRYFHQNYWFWQIELFKRSEPISE